MYGGAERIVWMHDTVKGGGGESITIRKLGSVYYNESNECDDALPDFF